MDWMTVSVSLHLEGDGYGLCILERTEDHAGLEA